MKPVTAQDKMDFSMLNGLLYSMDEETQIYLLGYINGLRDSSEVALPYSEGGGNNIPESNKNYSVVSGGVK